MTRSRLTGLHHLSAMSSHAQDTIDFYVGVLGLSLLKQTVNFDDPASYHLYFGNRDLQIGTMTFFVWPGAHRGQIGQGGTSLVSFPITSPSELERWISRLAQLGISTTLERIDGGGVALHLEDPDGLRLALVHRARELGTTAEGNSAIEQASASVSVPRLGPIDQVAIIVSDLYLSHQFYANLLGLSVASQKVEGALSETILATNQADTAGGNVPTVVLLQADETTPKFRLGAGLTHHFALQVASEVDLVAWRNFLNDAGVQTTDVKDRRYFKSIYFHDPDGHVVEIATTGPGFAIDEPVAQLGQHLSLPPWLEERRDEFVQQLPPLNTRPQSLN